MPIKLFEFENKGAVSQDRFEMAAALLEILTICQTAAKVGKRVEIRYDSVAHQNPTARVQRTSGVPTLTVYAHDWEKS